eukprot:GHVU01165939.1.p1 GENE.GHVU01165939.1~~GHVU01165939.1.p1  ORF type:complete len:136 (+),score=11.78 GHVU01165939.1:358-765(+)
MSVSWSPDGTRLASGSLDKTVRIWDASTGAPIGSPLNVGGDVSSVAFSIDGSKIAAAFNVRDDDYTILKEGGVTIFSNQGSAGFVCQSTLSGHSSWVRSVSWSPDGTKVASGSTDETVRIWEVATAAQPASGVQC